MSMEYARKELATAVAQSVPYPLFVLDHAGNYMDVVGGGDRSLYDSSTFLIGRNLFDVLPRERALAFVNIIRKAIDTGKLQVVEYELSAADCHGNPQDGPTGSQCFEGRVFPLKAESTDPSHTGRRFVLWAALNITHRKPGAELEEQFIGAQQEIVQICLFCKNVQNAENKWERLETYLEKNTRLSFSHGMCPECANRQYTGLL